MPGIRPESGTKATSTTQHPKPHFPLSTETTTSTIQDTLAPAQPLKPSTPICRHCRKTTSACICALPEIHVTGGHATANWDSNNLAFEEPEIHVTGGHTTANWDYNDLAFEEPPPWIIPLNSPVIKCRYCGLWASEDSYGCAVGVVHHA